MTKWQARWLGAFWVLTAIRLFTIGGWWVVAAVAAMVVAIVIDVRWADWWPFRSPSS